MTKSYTTKRLILNTIWTLVLVSGAIALAFQPTPMPISGFSVMLFISGLPWIITLGNNVNNKQDRNSNK